MFKSLAAALLLSLLAAPAFAEAPLFVTPEQSEAVLLLLDPPAEGSAVQSLELALLHEIEQARTPEQAAAADWDANHQVIFLFKNLFGEAFSAENLPATAALGKRVAEVSIANVRAAKTRFGRPRPYEADPTLHPVCKADATRDSYPSGHAMLGWMMGLTLVEMVPEQREAILLRAQDYGHSRMVCGVHYPSDVEASRPLAYAVHAIMAQDPQYKLLLDAARTELRKFLGLSEPIAAK